MTIIFDQKAKIMPFSESRGSFLKKSSLSQMSSCSLNVTKKILSRKFFFKNSETVVPYQGFSVERIKSKCRLFTQKATK